MDLKNAYILKQETIKIQVLYHKRRKVLQEFTKFIVLTNF